MISTRALTRDFVVSRTETVHAVRGISLDVAPGELVAVLGPNGAGKTTTLRMLTTLITPTSGTATVAGYDVTTQPGQVRRRIGYVGQGNGAGHTQRVGDELRGQGVIYGLDRRAAKQRADELLDALELRELAQRKVSDLSGGQRRRLDVAMGLVHAPSLLFLDEPSTGLDPQNRANLWDHILRMRSEHEMTIVLTTHYLDEADTMAERVVVVDHGEVIADDTASALKAKLAGDRLALTVAPDNLSRLTVLAEKLPGAREVVATGDELSVRVADGPAALPELIAAAQHDGVPIASAQVHRPTLDDVFLNLTGRNLREAA
ncbi:ATP-binding cassette domain-containing protein [Kribbella sp. NPDC000426]|uniref:ATP-binding cassette domain-containing protein n=1 Tax=Kribbella sp. NPDC000426 TaxID=3154255 RepID=UPI00332ACF56